MHTYMHTYTALAVTFSREKSDGYAEILGQICDVMGTLSFGIQMSKHEDCVEVLPF